MKPVKVPAKSVPVVPADNATELSAPVVSEVHLTSPDIKLNDTFPFPATALS